ncbi:MAG: large-conductance mechanosensitive channel protein MscL [Bacteriovoracaceae bacterium]|nr:large-conductance mechanosensitive channel protein MscL [Bacteriovoracaceae bacterium]
MLKEFRDFAMKGNVVDLAVGVIIGGAFGKIVSSVVNDIIMPFLGLLTGGIDLSGLKYIIREGVDGLPPLAIKYGMFLQSVIDFVIISFSIFLFIKVLMKLKKEEKTDAAPAAPKEEVVLLSEIRDLLKK